MKPEVIAILATFAVFTILEILFTNFFHKPKQNKQDGWVEILSSAILIIVTQPLVLFLGGYVVYLVAPWAENSLIDISIFSGVLLFLIFDDMTQYWWHRISHNVTWLYNLHRPHHNAEYLSVRVVYRNNVFYYLLMPGLWLSGALIYLGLGWIYVGYIIVKMLVIIGAHSDVHWDAPLYKIKWLSPIMWVVERTISTPSTHSAHHGKHKSDGITNYKGNFGNLLFFWDVLFGTAKITRQYPLEMGVENLPDTTLGEQLFWPIIKAK
jgi:sterol desaturase/sphingolipid hydroxylase (fatty acid hydroxylase superfamily)